MNKNQLGEAIKNRETDIANYQINIDNYTAMIDMLPKEWPERLLPYKDSDPASFLDKWYFEEIELLSDLQFREKLRRTLTTELLEQRKSIFVLRALQQKLDKNEL